MDSEIKHLADKLGELKASIEVGFATIDRRLAKLEDSHKDVSLKTSAHEERFLHMKNAIDKTNFDLNNYSAQRLTTDRYQYEKINQLRSLIQINEGKANDKSQEMFFKWIPLIGSIIAGVLGTLAFINK